MFNAEYFPVYHKGSEVKQLSSLQVAFWGPLMLRGEGRGRGVVGTASGSSHLQGSSAVIGLIYCDSMYNFIGENDVV